MKALSIQSKPVYDSARQGSSGLRELREIGKYRYLLGQLIKRDLTTRYKRSVLGVAWTMLNPLGTMIILSVVFSRLFGAEGNYPVYVLTGLTAWNFFSQGTNAAIGNLVWGGSMLNRIYIPRTIFGVSAVGTAFVNTIIALVPLVLVMLATGASLHPAMLFLPVPIILLACFTLGWGLFLSSVAVFFPDVAEMYQLLLTAWMYLTPIIYPESMPMAATLQKIFPFNPMYWMVKNFRIPVLEGRLPTLAEFWPAAAFGLGMLVIGWLFFTSKSDEYAYRV